MAIPNPTDRYVGQRLQKRRRALGLSQQTLATRVHLTCQQIRKYERGENRIAAGRLYDFAKILRVPILYFFETAKGRFAPLDKDASGLQHKLNAFAGSKEGGELLSAFRHIRDSKIRRTIVRFVRTLVDER